MTRSRYLGFRIAPDEWRAAQQTIQQSGLTQADWLRRAVREALQRDVLAHRFEALLHESERRQSALITQAVDRALAEIDLEILDEGENDA